MYHSDPLAVETEGVGLDAAAGDVRPEGATAGNAAKIAVPRGVLAPFQLGDQMLQPPPQLAVRGVGGRGDHAGEGGEVMAGGMAVETGAFPVPVGLRPGLQAGFAEERREKPVGIEREGDRRGWLRPRE